MAKKNGNGKQITLRLPDQLYRSWFAEAEERGITISTLIRLRMAGREVVSTTRKAG
jgi:hypothetical protein